MEAEGLDTVENNGAFGIQFPGINHHRIDRTELFNGRITHHHGAAFFTQQGQSVQQQVAAQKPGEGHTDTGRSGKGGNRL